MNRNFGKFENYLALSIVILPIISLVLCSIGPQGWMLFWFPSAVIWAGIVGLIFILKDRF